MHARAGGEDEPHPARPATKTKAEIDDKDDKDDKDDEMMAAMSIVRRARADRRAPIQQCPDAPVRPVMTFDVLTTASAPATNAGA